MDLSLDIVSSESDGAKFFVHLFPIAYALCVEIQEFLESGVLRFVLVALKGDDGVVVNAGKLHRGLLGKPCPLPQPLQS